MENNNNLAKTEKRLYKTHSICPKCAIIDRKGVNWTPATVVERNDKVWLEIRCERHGNFDVLYCSNAEFFQKTLQFSYELKGAEFPQTDDLEDLLNKTKYSSESTNLPMALEISVWENGDFLKDEEIAQRINYYKSLYPPNRQFVLKVLGRMSMDMIVLNQKVLYIESLLGSDAVIVLETSYERLATICKLDNSVFLRPSIFPALKYFLRQGDEQQCKMEMTNLFDYLREFTNMQLMVTICVNRPYPDLGDLLSFIREQCGFIRVLVISMERSPKELTISLREEQNQPVDSKTELNHAESNDIYELLQHIQRQSFNSLLVDDFYPMSSAAAMEPFLNLMGYGHYFIRPSPFCGYVTCLVNHGKSYMSYPVTRLFDFEKLFLGVKKILPRLQDGKIGLMNAQKLKKIFLSSANPNKGQLPDLYAYLTEKSKAQITRQFIQNLQFVVVHNNMDIAAFDLVRRCNCAVGTKSALHTDQGVASYCTGCV